MNLEERCLMLEEENRQLRQALKISDPARYPAKWRLGGAECRVLSSLIAAPAGFRSHDALFRAARRWESTQDGRGLLSVVMCKLRKKLKPFGVNILTIHGEGYKIDDASRAVVVGARTQEVVR